MSKKEFAVTLEFAVAVTDFVIVVIALERQFKFVENPWGAPFELR